MPERLSLRAAKSANIRFEAFNYVLASPFGSSPLFLNSKRLERPTASVAVGAIKSLLRKATSRLELLQSTEQSDFGLLSAEFSSEAEAEGVRRFVGAGRSAPTLSRYPASLTLVLNWNCLPFPLFVLSRFNPAQSACTESVMLAALAMVRLSSQAEVVGYESICE